jgi:ribulose-bisphosphate carboxylase small chain
MAVQVYKAATKYETFSYLPVMTADQVRRQIAYCHQQLLVHVEAALLR